MYGSVPVRSGSPWQVEQVSARTSTTPSTWVAALARTTEYPAWQMAQSALFGWGAGGGAPWQEVQVFWVPSTSVQTGVVARPPASAVLPPWQ